MGTITHAKTNAITDWTQAQLDAQIALGNFASGTLLANIVLPSDWNAGHTISLVKADVGLGNVDNTSNATERAAVATLTNKSISGNQITSAVANATLAATLTNATLTTALTVNTGAVTLAGNVANTSALTIGAGAVSVSGTNTGDQTNISGNAATVTTNANLTGHITSTGNAAVLGSFTIAQLNTAVSDADLAKTTTNTFTGAQIGAVTALTSTAASIAIDLAVNNNFSHTTSENTTLAAPSNPVAGQSGVITITQGATARLLAYNTFWKFPGGTIPTLTAVVGAVDVFAYNVESATRATCQLLKDSK